MYYYYYYIFIAQKIEGQWKMKYRKDVHCNKQVRQGKLWTSEKIPNSIIVLLSQQSIKVYLKYSKQLTYVCCIEERTVDNWLQTTLSLLEKWLNNYGPKVSSNTSLTPVNSSTKRLMLAPLPMTFFKCSLENRSNSMVNIKTTAHFILNVSGPFVINLVPLPASDKTNIKAVLAKRTKLLRNRDRE